MSPKPGSDAAMAAADLFGLKRSEAQEINEQLSAALADSRAVMETAGLSDKDRRFLSQCLPKRFQQGGSN